MNECVKNTTASGPAREPAPARQSWFAHYTESLRLLSRNAKLYLLGAFLFGLIHASYQLLFNLYLRERGLSEAMIGGVLSSTATGAALMALPAGILLFRMKLKPVLILAVLVYAGSIALLSTWENTSALWLFAFGSGVAMTFFRVATNPFYMRNSTERERPMLFSLGFAMMTLSGALGSFGGGYLVAFFESATGDPVLAYRYALYVGISLGLLGIIPFLLIKAKPPSESERKLILSWKIVRERLPLYSKLFTPFFLVGLGAGFIIPFLNIYFRDKFGKGAEVIGLYFFGVQAATFIGAMVAPALVRKIGRMRTVVFSELASVPFMLLLVYTGDIYLAVFAFLIRAALMNLGQPVASNFSLELVSRQEHGLVNSLLFMAWTGSWTISTSVGGILIERYGYEIPMIITASLYTLSALLYFAFFRKDEFKENGVFVIAGRGQA